MSCLLNKSQIDRNCLFKSLRHRKRRRKNGFQIFPCLITCCEWTEGNLFKPFFRLLFSGVEVFFPPWKNRSQYATEVSGSLGYTVASQSILKRHTCAGCAPSAVESSQERSAGVMGNRCGCFSPLRLICFTHSAVRWLWCLGRAHSRLYALTHPLTTQVGDY